MYVKQDEADKLRFFVSVEEIDYYTREFKQADGMVVVEKQGMPGIGYSIVETDPEENLLGLYH